MEAAEEAGRSRPLRRATCSTSSDPSSPGLLALRAEYFRFVIKALRISPGLVETFITFAVQGRHFFIITRRFLRGRAAALEAAANLGKSVPLAT